MALAHAPTPFSLSGLRLGAQRSAPGLLLCAALAAGALVLARQPWAVRHGLSALTLALALGLLLGNTLYPRLAMHTDAGVALAKQQLLRTAIVLYGLRLTLQDVALVGWYGVLVDVLVLCSTLGLALLLGRRWLGIDARTTLLIGAGSSICGAAAVLAAAPVVRARTQDIAVAVATVVVFGSAGLVLYPALYRWGVDAGWLAADPAAFGLYIGATVHEVAQVVAAATAVAPQAADAAVIAKMVRVMLLAPFLLLLSWALARRAGPAQAGGRVAIPWFALGFVLLAGVNSLGVLPPALVRAGVQLDDLLLALAMAALGLTTHVQAVRAAGARPLLLAALLFAWLLGAGWVLTQVLPGWF